MLLCNNVYAEDKNNDVSKDKIYVIYLRDSPGKRSIVLTNAISQEFLGSKYLIGLSQRMKNVKMRIPTSNIALIMEYKNEKEYRQSIIDYNKKWGKESKNEEQGIDPKLDETE